MSRRTILSTLAFAALAATLGAMACTTSDPSPDSSPAACAVAASQKLACPVLPGEFPPPDCDPASEKDPRACRGGGCAIDEAKCGAASTCLPLADNRGSSVLDFRVRRLNLAAPEVLAALDFQQKVTIPSIDLKNPECGEHGSGGWSWLLRFDREKKTLTTGGAPPSTDPFNLGYCFFNSAKNGTTLAPASQVPIRVDQPAGVYSSGTAPKLTMPIFLGGDPNNIVVLPISDFAVRDVKLSSDDNCIGAFNPKALDGACKEDPASCSKWKTAGAMAGWISLEDADAITVVAFNQSLCALLTKHAGPKCPREGGKITLEGDYCGRTRQPCDCKDAFWLAGTFAASAVRIHDGSSVPECGQP